MKLSQFGIAVRKAAALAGIAPDAEASPFFDTSEHAGTPLEIKMKVGGEYITSGDMAYADHLTWKEINERK